MALLEGKDVMVGVIDVASDVVETPEEVADTIGRALQFVPRASADCRAPTAAWRRWTARWRSPSCRRSASARRWRANATAHEGSSAMSERTWKHDGVQVIRGDQLDPNTAQTPGMDRKAAITFARTGAQKLWAGTVHIHANAKTGAHHHGPLESVIFVVRGRARMRWGERLEFTAEAGPGDFIYVPPFVPHQEINASVDQTLECVLVRSDGEATAINVDIEPVEKPESVEWVDPIHRARD